MKHTELRAGNWVNFHGKPHQITAYEIYKLSEGACFDETPIPLSYEWLERLGIDPDNNTVAFGNIDGFLVYNEQDNCIFLEGDDEDHLYSQPIRYVHQVQNLFFILSGYEMRGFVSLAY